MRFSTSLKSSAQSLPSPNGAFIATLLPSKLSIRETRSLEVTRVISLPPEVAAVVHWFLWSESSNRILLASTDNIRAYSAVDTQFSANITYPTSGTTKVAFVTFGATDDEICVFSEFGLKLSIFNLSTSKSVDISSPKFYNPGVAARGISYRPGTLNLALLIRSGGKDIISVHTRDTLEIKRSWHPDTIDAQGLNWSPDGRWLAVWESASQGHRMLVYTADGHPYKQWNGPTPITEDETDLSLGAGIKLFEWNQTGSHVAIGDYSRRVNVLAAPSFMEATSLLHTTAITPADSLQIWQEQLRPSPNGGFVREFMKATQSTCPPTSGSAPTTDGSVKTGTNIMAFDNSGTLLATRTENMPTTLWIWDISTRILRAVMIFHAPIAKATWHPSIDELLLVRCEGEESRGLVHVWDPIWAAPKIIDFASQMTGGEVIGKTVGRWLNTESGAPAVFFSDSQDCVLASISVEGEELPWSGAESRGVDIYGQMGESPLSLVAADEKRAYGRVEEVMDMEDENMTRLSGGSSEVDDTFRFKKFVEPKSSPSPWT